MRLAAKAFLAPILAAATVFAAPPPADIANAAQRGNLQAVRQLINQGSDVNASQADGTTALLWAAEANNLELVRVLIEAGANVTAANVAGASPLLLASQNGNAELLKLLLDNGADANTSLTRSGDTALMMAARTGKVDAVGVLLDAGADVNAQETWGGTSPLMWALQEGHTETVRLLLERGADIAQRSYYVPSASGRGFEGATPIAEKPEGEFQEFSSGWMTPLMFAAREDRVESLRLLLDAGADINARAADGKDALSLALFDGSYAAAEFLIDNGADVNQQDAQRFTPLFWAVDRRNMETAPNFPWMQTRDPLPLIEKMLERGADPNTLINATPRARMREGSPRIVYATVLMRAALAGDHELAQLLLSYGADPNIISEDRETVLMAACGTGFINGYHSERPPADRLALVKLLVEEQGLDVNAADNYGITPLMVAANLGDIEIVKYLISQGADLGAFDLGKKNDGAFGSSVEPLMPIDYAIGVGTFRPNNAIVMHEELMNYMAGEMEQRGIEHMTSECTLRGFTCSQANVDPKTATPAEIARIRSIQRGYKVDGITGGLDVEVSAEEPE